MKRLRKSRSGAMLKRRMDSFVIWQQAGNLVQIDRSKEKDMRYKVVFEVMNDRGVWQQDDISFCGTMTRKEAEYWCNDLRQREKVRNVRMADY